MHYRLRTLLILLAVGPPVLAAAWPIACKQYEEFRLRQILRQAERENPHGGLRMKYRYGSSWAEGPGRPVKE